MIDFLPIETPYSSKDYEMMKKVVNMGIDSHLEGFTKSEFKKSPHFNNKFLWNIHDSELPILYRRLESLYEKTGDDDYQSFLDDIRSVSDTSKTAIAAGEYKEDELDETIGQPSNNDLNGADEFEMSEAELKEMIKRELNSMQGESLGTPGLAYEDQTSEFPKVEENASDSLANQHGENLKPLDETTDQERYEQVVFMQGQDADEAMDILNNDGRDAAMDYLKQWHDSGNHMGSNELGHGTQDKTYEKDGYIMNWNPYLPYIGLVYDTEYGKTTPGSSGAQTLSKDEGKTRLKSFKDFIAKFGIVPTGITGKFKIEDFNEAATKFDDDDAFDFAMVLANIYLGRKIGMSWDDLGDTNSLWDYIHKGMTPREFFVAAKDAANERLSQEDIGEMDEDSQMKRHQAGQREKEVPLGQYAPHSQAAINENMLDELSPETKYSAFKKAADFTRQPGDVHATDPLTYIKRKNQGNAFATHISPDLKIEANNIAKMLGDERDSNVYEARLEKEVGGPEDEQAVILYIGRNIADLNNAVIKIVIRKSTHTYKPYPSIFVPENVKRRLLNFIKKVQAIELV